LRLRDGKAGWGLFCRGAGALPFGAQIRPVLDLMQWLLGGIVPAALAEEMAV
jgi:nitronate monooxygenase